MEDELTEAEIIRQAMSVLGKRKSSAKKASSRRNGGMTTDEPLSPLRILFALSSEWKSAVRFVRKRDNNQCRRCGAIRNTGDLFHVHHIVPFACVELRTEPSNLLYVCDECHYWIHSNANTKREFIKAMPCPEDQNLFENI